MTVFLAHHAVAEAIGGAGELDRHERHRLEAVELPPLEQQLGDDAALGDALDEVVQHHPLVVPADELRRLFEQLRRRRARRDVIDDLVVELEQREVGLRDDQVFVVAMIADERDAVAGALEIVRQVRDRAAGRIGRGRAGADEKLRRILPEQEAVRPRAGAVEAVEIQSRRPEVLDHRRIFLLRAERAEIQRDVVVDELAEVGEARGDRLVVQRRAVGTHVLHRDGERLEVVVGRDERRQVEHAIEEALPFGPSDFRHARGARRGHGHRHFGALGGHRDLRRRGHGFFGYHVPSNQPVSTDL